MLDRRPRLAEASEAQAIGAGGRSQARWLSRHFFLGHGGACAVFSRQLGDVDPRRSILMWRRAEKERALIFSASAALKAAKAGRRLGNPKIKKAQRSVRLEWY
jgi:hypothetical protein